MDKDLFVLKEKIMADLSSIDRSGVGKLINYLEEDTDFFTAPASSRFHNNHKGGLAEHSLTVFNNMVDLNAKYNLEIPHESLIIEGLLHDICKVNKYKIDDEDPSNAQINYIHRLVNKCNFSIQLKNGKIKVDGRKDRKLTKSYASDVIGYLKDNHTKSKADDFPKKENAYSFRDDLIPLGHGEKSVAILMRFIELKTREQLAIRWHMGPWEESVISNNSRSRDYRQAKTLYPDVGIISLSDGEASFSEKWC